MCNRIYRKTHHTFGQVIDPAVLGFHVLPSRLEFGLKLFDLLLVAFTGVFTVGSRLYGVLNRLVSSFGSFVAYQSFRLDDVMVPLIHRGHAY